MATLSFTFGLLLSSTPTFAQAKAQKPKPDWSYVQKRLRQEGFKPDFIRSLKKNYEPAEFLEVLELNTLLFLKKSDYHGPQVDEFAADSVRQFVQKNKIALDKAETKYGVSREVIASLLWIESRHGSNKGEFHVPSVFVDLVQADRPVVVSHLYKAAKRFTAKVTRKDRRDIALRTKKRVKWALEELHAIAKMQRKDKTVLPDLRGSFAGAFGMPQFIPSSFVHYAKALKAGQPAHLEKAGDAIQSVAFYLHSSGWRAGRKKTYVKALLKYNNSQDYAKAILNLAKQAAPEASDAIRRIPSSPAPK